jgi:hypothetical protein
MVKKSSVGTNEKKISMVFRRLIFFLVLGLISFGLYSISGNELYINLFALLGVLFGFVSLALFIALLALLLVKALKK